MKKLTSLLLALVMVFSMLPGTALPVAAAGEDEAIVANYTAAAPTVDGKLDETLWLLRDKIGSVPVTVVTNVDKLFIGMKTNQAKATFTASDGMIHLLVDNDFFRVMLDRDEVKEQVLSVLSGLDSLSASTVRAVTVTVSKGMSQAQSDSLPELPV